jgi:hypothetical protein
MPTSQTQQPKKFGRLKKLFWREPSSVDPNQTSTNLAPADGFLILLKIGVFGLFTYYNVKFFLKNAAPDMRWPTAIMAILLEITAFWFTIWWSRTRGIHRLALFMFGIVLIVISASHAAFAYYQLQPPGTYEMWTLDWYVHVVSFPLIFCTLALASLIVPSLHWDRKYVRDQVKFDVDIERDKAALRAETAMLESASTLEEMKLEHMKRDAETRRRRLDAIEHLVDIKREEDDYINSLPDPYLRAEAIRLINEGSFATMTGSRHVQNSTPGIQSHRTTVHRVGRRTA